MPDRRDRQLARGRNALFARRAVFLERFAAAGGGRKRRFQRGGGGAGGRNRRAARGGAQGAGRQGGGAAFRQQTDGQSVQSRQACESDDRRQFSPDPQRCR